jgi:hypothetical protein
LTPYDWIERSLLGPVVVVLEELRKLVAKRLSKI